MKSSVLKNNNTFLVIFQHFLFVSPPPNSHQLFCSTASQAAEGVTNSVRGWEQPIISVREAN